MLSLVKIESVSGLLNVKVLSGVRAGEWVKDGDGKPIPFKTYEFASEWVKHLGYDLVSNDGVTHRGLNIVRSEFTGKFHVFYNETALFETYTFHKVDDAKATIDHHYQHLGK